MKFCVQSNYLEIFSLNFLNRFQCMFTSFFFSFRSIPDPLTIRGDFLPTLHLMLASLHFPITSNSRQVCRPFLSRRYIRSKWWKSCSRKMTNANFCRFFSTSISDLRLDSHSRIFFVSRSNFELNLETELKNIEINLTNMKNKRFVNFVLSGYLFQLLFNYVACFEEQHEQRIIDVFKWLKAESAKRQF